MTDKPVKPVVTLGEALWVCNGPPDAPLDVGATASCTFAGAESNLAIGLARLGHPVRWLSALGDDVFGRSILRHLRGEGVDASRVSLSSTHPTAVMFKIHHAGASGEPEVIYYRRGSACSALNADSFDASAWSDAAVVYLTGITMALSGGARQFVERVIDDASRRGVPIWFDPNYRRKLWSEDDARRAILPLLPKLDCVLLGLDEGRMLTGRDEAKAVADELRGRGVQRVVVRSDASGSHCFDDDSPDGTFAAAPALPRLVDPIGAGDAFAAGFLSAHLDGLETLASLQRAHALAAMVCLTRGDWEGLPSHAALESSLSTARPDARR